MALLKIENLLHYRNLGYNVLLEGEAGVGKTALIHAAFDGLKSKYFSAPTMDPWVDLVGVPRPAQDAKLGEVLDLVRPRFVVENEVEAIFIDELNRAPDKVMNAVMELIQFKSINGFKLKNLKVIWCAINPDDDDGEYATNRLDKALRDRFHVQIRVPYKLDEDYFRRKYPEVADAFIGWWQNLPTEMQKRISPRRLDYTADAYMNGCQLGDFLPEGANVAQLKKLIKAAPFQDQLNAVETEAQAKEFLKEINNATKLLQLVNNKDRVAQAFFKRWKHILPQELVDAIAPAIHAAETGARIVTLAALLPNLKGKAGEVELTHQINEVAFSYGNGSTLQDEIGREIRINSQSFKKLTGHIVAVLSKAPEPVLRQAMFRPDTTDRSNLTTLAMHIAAQDTTFAIFSKEDRKKINAHTFLLKCAGAKWM